MSVSAIADDIEAIIARTALKYDLLPYQSKPFAQSQPARLGAIAKLFALNAAPMENARVLELGCASGGNITPHAVRYPNAKFVGVDLARTQVAAGRARIAKLGLSNIEILCQSFTEIDDTLGSFDYIICHGVYSWVPAVVQDAIFRIIRARLSPVGVACVSYNVLPGWRMLQPLRDAFLLQIPDHVDSLARVAQARELLNFLKDASPDKGPYGDMLRSWAERLSQLPDDYIAHEFLEETNIPSTVREFASSATRHGLGYLGECELSSMILDNYGAEVAEQVRTRSGNDLVESEQYLDLLSGRTFRQSLLVGNERMADLNRALSPERTDGLHFIGAAGLRIEENGKTASVIDAAGRTLTSDAKPVIDGIKLFIERFPASSSLDDLAGDMDDTARAQLQDALYRMMIAGMVHVISEQVNVVPAVSDKPCAIALARADAADGEELTTNQRHETVAIDAAARILLPAMDGKHNHAALNALLTAAALAGQLTFNKDGAAVSGATEIETVAAQYLPELLSGIASAGLIES
jgi:methyltransferase-like protein/cyclopropane fatty-acyl-phospholipid synthase-like methyltransferase